MRVWRQKRGSMHNQESELQILDFRERAAIFDHTVRGDRSHTSRASGFSTQDRAQARDSNAARGNFQDMEATLANLLRKEYQGCSEARRPRQPRPTYSIFRCDCHLPAMDSADRLLRPVAGPCIISGALVRASRYWHITFLYLTRWTL